MFRKELSEGQAGDQVGALLRGIKKNVVRRGMVVCHPSAMESQRTFQAQVSPPSVGNYYYYISSCCSCIY